MKTLLIFPVILLFFLPVYGQDTVDPCTYQSTMQRHLELNPNAEQERMETEEELQRIIRDQKENAEQRDDDSFVIPVVMHVFHDGDDGKMDMEQALSGLEIMNQDFNGLNDGWDSIDPEFDPIKATLDITFCLATIDPAGNPTAGIVYHEDPAAMLNEGNLFQHAWDNYKYLNIYFPKYTQGAPSDFTAYAYFPSTSNTDANQDGIFYSSIRWGFGNHSILEEGDDWASVCAHEAGHWLNLRHTFQNGCNGSGDSVDDTPPTLGGTIELEGCDNNDLSCGVATNGENFMDYNHRCKKMFTQGQVDRMTAALYLPSRINLWSPDNLVATGCNAISTASHEIDFNSEQLVYPNPASNSLYISTAHQFNELTIFNAQGQSMANHHLQGNENQINVAALANGIYFYVLRNTEQIQSGKFVVKR